MRIRVGIAIYQLIALFKSFYRPLKFCNFTLCNLQKKIQHMGSSPIPDCLDNSRCGSFLCLHNFRLLTQQYISQLGTLLFQIAQLLITLEQTLISGAKEWFYKMSKERQENWQNPILSGLLMSDLSKKKRGPNQGAI